jgi:hypothetical protein
MSVTSGASASGLELRREWGLSADEAEAVLSCHLTPGIVEARIACGCFVVCWWPADEESASELPVEGVAAESSESFESAIRLLARRRPDLLRESLDAPEGLLVLLRGGTRECRPPAAA